jgi:dTDP-4-dehydrorhamnose 3,5-epimerase
VQITELEIPDSFLVETNLFGDDRGLFLESFRYDKLQEITGRYFQIRQVNTSVSQAGVLRGIHFASVPQGQAKYVTVHAGSIIDYIVDVRIGSETYGKWTSVTLDSVDRNAVFLSEGLGHAFLSLEDNTVVSYLVSDTYKPASEYGIHPLDTEIGLELPSDFSSPILSGKDEAAPSFRVQSDQGKLPTITACAELYNSQKAVN